MPLPILQLHPPSRLIPKPATDTGLIARHSRTAFSFRHVSRALVSSAAEEPEDQASDSDEEKAEADGDTGFFADMVVFSIFGAVLGVFIDDEG